MSSWPDLQCEYDEGYFDKDEQGWCARCVQISQEGPAITLRSWGDDNGARPYDHTRRGLIEQLFPEQGLVRLGGDLAGSYFDLRTRRLRSRSEQDTYRGPAWPDYTQPAGVSQAIDLVATLVEALTERPAPRPAPPPWPPLVPSTTCMGTLDCTLHLHQEPFSFFFSHRLFPAHPGEPHMSVGLAGPEASVFVHVESPAKALVVVSGPLERRQHARLALARLGIPG